MDDNEHWIVVDRMRQRRMDALKEKDKKSERLRKEKGWLIDRCVKNEHYIHNLWAPDQLSEKERREKITKALQQALKGKG